MTNKIKQNLVQKRCKHTKAFMSGSDDMINKYSVVPDFKERNSFSPQNENERENKIRNSA